MRILKVKVRRGNPTKGEDMLVYPKRFDAKEVHYHGGMTRLGSNMVDVCMGGDIGRGGEYQYLVLTLPSPLAEEYANDPDMMLITSDEADTLMEEFRKGNNVPTEVIKDRVRIEAIKLKRDLIQADPTTQLTITQEDLDALDPTKDTPGINRARKPVREIITPDDNLTTVSERQKRIESDRTG